MLLAGCSRFQLETVPDRAKPGPSVRCDDDSPLPLVDASITVMAYAIAIAGFGLVMYADANEDDALGWTGAGAAAMVFPGAAFGWSAAWGEAHVTACARARRGLPP